jgi:hypothetical protein
MRLHRITAITALFAGALSAQTLKTEKVYGRPAYVLENDRFRVSLLRGGGHVAEARLRSNDARKNVNPMRVPHYQTIDPHTYDAAKHDALFGTDPHRWLHSGYLGHFICFPAFGPPSSEWEVKSGLGNHGEAPIVEWKPIGEPSTQGRVLVFRYGADLPKTQFRMERSVTLARGESVAYVEEWAENLTNYDRPVNWVQHATFGPPFIAPGKSFLDLSGTKGQVAGGAPATSSLKPDSTFTWPEGETPSGEKVSLRVFQPKPKTGIYFAVQMDQTRPFSYFTLYNPDFSVLIGYVFRTSESPWIGDFQENQRIQTKPWDGKVVTRGIEFGTTPFAEGLKRSVERGSLFGVPSFRWMRARERAKTSFLLFVAEIPEGFAGVADVAVRDSALEIAERGTDRRITLPASQLRLLQGR